MSEDDAWTSVKIDRCTHGQRLIVPGPGGAVAVKYCQKVWEYFAAKVKLPPKSSDKCQSDHVHVDDDYMCFHADEGKRTSQVSRRLLNALKFAASSDGRLRAMPVSIPKGPVERVIVNLSDSGIGFAGPKSEKGCARIACRERLGTCAREEELVKQVKKACSNDLRTPVLFVASLLRSGAGPGEVEGSCVGDERCPGRKYKSFRIVLKSLKHLLKKCAEFSNVYFSLDMPSSCPCWSWPELYALVSSSKVKRVKVADHVDATGR